MRSSVVLFTIVALMVVALMPLGIALAQGANPIRVLPAVVDKGETFDVTVNLTAPDDDFRLITVVDLAPAGWNVTVSGTWCTPTPSFVIATGNKAQIVWSGPFSNGTPLAAVYKVTVPDDAESGFHTFNGLLGYYLASSEHIFEDITGDSGVEVVLGPRICFSPLNLSFSAVAGDSNLANKTLEIWNSGGGTLNWALSDNAA